MDIQGEHEVRTCVVLPIDNDEGTVIDGYEAYLPDGSQTMKFFGDVKLNLVAIEHRNKKNGVSHGLKPTFSNKIEQRMTEEQVYAIPWCGVVKPWASTTDKEQKNEVSPYKKNW